MPSKGSSEGGSDSAGRAGRGDCDGLASARLERAPRRLEVRKSVALIRLEMCSLSPLVPRIEEHEAVLRRLVESALDRCSEPLLVRLGRRVVQHPATLTGAGRVVPAGADRLVATIRDGIGAGEHGPCLLVVEDAQALGPVDVELRNGLQKRELRLEEDLCVEADLGRIPTRIPPGLDGDQMETGEPGLPHLSPPEIGRPGGIGQILCLVDDEDGLVVDRQRPRVAQRGQEPADVLEVVLLAVGLWLEDVLFPSVPAT